MICARTTSSAVPTAPRQSRMRALVRREHTQGNFATRVAVYHATTLHQRYSPSVPCGREAPERASGLGARLCAATRRDSVASRPSAPTIAIRAQARTQTPHWKCLPEPGDAPWTPAASGGKLASSTAHIVSFFTIRALLDIGHHTNTRAVEPVVRCSSSLSWPKTCVPVGHLYKWRARPATAGTSEQAHPCIARGKSFFGRAERAGRVDLASPQQPLHRAAPGSHVRAQGRQEVPRGQEDRRRLVRRHLPGHQRFHQGGSRWVFFVPRAACAFDALAPPPRRRVDPAWPSQP